MNPGFWHGRRVLITGHTGFKGAWLALWLAREGAEVVGFSGAGSPERSLFEVARVEAGLHGDIRGDVRDAGAVAAAVRQARPEVVFHLAAQSLVRRSFADPISTYAINVMGTLHVLEAIRASADARVALVVTSDKCYENREWVWGYREDEPMGGKDPYSSSKGCAELVTHAYRSTWFSSPAGARIASARAGNVIGGGDWGRDRLVPDIMRAALSGEPFLVRNPDAVRPWQHVLNTLGGYLRLAERLWDRPELAEGWNFGPDDRDVRPVRWIADRICHTWGDGLSWTADEREHPREAHWLKLDSSKARVQLGWRPNWDLGDGLDRTVAWYRALAAGEDMREHSLAQIAAFEAAAT